MYYNVEKLLNIIFVVMVVLFFVSFYKIGNTADYTQQNEVELTDAVK